MPVPDPALAAPASLPTIPAPASPLPAHIVAAVEQAAAYAAQASTEATRRAYTADWADWSAWCAGTGLTPLPADPAALGAYLADLAGRRAVSTITRRLSAISTAHRLAGMHLDTRHPAIRDVLKGIRRAHGTAPKRARAATTAILRSLVETCDASLLGLRDAALLLMRQNERSARI